MDMALEKSYVIKITPEQAGIIHNLIEAAINLMQQDSEDFKKLSELNDIVLDQCSRGMERSMELVKKN